MDIYSIYVHLRSFAANIFPHRGRTMSIQVIS